MAYRVEVRSLFSSLSASRTVSGQLELSDVELGEQVYRFDGPVSFDVTLTNAGTGIVAEGCATARVLTPCVRCLVDTSVEVTADIDGFYVLPGHDADLPEEQEFELIGEDMSIDVQPAIEQSIVVELPFAPLHDDECKGICPVCGADRNVTECDCGQSPKSSPFDALRNMISDESSES